MPALKMPHCSSSTNGGQTWAELPGLRGHGTGAQWQPGAGGMCLHTIILDPKNRERIFVAISAAGAFRSDDGGATWKPINTRPPFTIHSRSKRRGGPLRSSRRTASCKLERAVYAEALGRYAQRRCGRLVAQRSAVTCRPISDL